MYYIELDNETLRESVNYYRDKCSQLSTELKSNCELTNEVQRLTKELEAARGSMRCSQDALRLAREGIKMHTVGSLDGTNDVWEDSNLRQIIDKALGMLKQLLSVDAIKERPESR